jgi:hypothetical protein
MRLRSVREHFVSLRRALIVGAETSQKQTTAESDRGEFAFTVDATRQPTAQENIDAARTNAFYLVNTVHDISYLYGELRALLRHIGRGSLSVRRRFHRDELQLSAGQPRQWWTSERQGDHFRPGRIGL